MKTIYVGGKITGDEFYREKFYACELVLRSRGFLVMNPAILPEGFSHRKYMKICFAMIDACEYVFFLRDWEESEGAREEHDYAQRTGREILYEVAD